jgi:hypothetical protein
LSGSSAHRAVIPTKKYTKNHTIDTFVTDDIVTIKLPCGTRTSTYNRRIFAWVFAMPKPNRYEFQTKYSVIERLMATKELEVVPLLIVIEVGGLSKKIALSKAALEASTSDRVVISCKWKEKALVSQKRAWANTAGDTFGDEAESWCRFVG